MNPLPNRLFEHFLIFPSLLPKKERNHQKCLQYFQYKRNDDIEFTTRDNFDPLRANSKAVAAPIPELDPVINTTLSFSPDILQK